MMCRIAQVYYCINEINLLLLDGFTSGQISMTCNWVSFDSTEDIGKRDLRLCGPQCPRG